MLENEFKFYLENQKQLLQKFNGKFLVIKGTDIIGVYDTEKEAYEEAGKKNELGTFLIQFCSPGETNYSQTFHSRVAA